MADEKPSLEGRLNVSIGDLILLQSPDYDCEAVGFVNSLSYGSVVLSSENPSQRVPWKAMMKSFLHPFSGKKIYYLTGFTDYEVLREANQE